MLKLKKVIILSLLIVGLTACQKEESNLDKTKIPDVVYNQVRDFSGYKTDAVYYYQGNHIKVNGESFGKAMIVKIVISHYDTFKDPNEHEIISVLSDQEHYYTGQEVIYDDDKDILVNIEQWEVYDANRPVKFINAMNDREIREVNLKLGVI